MSAELKIRTPEGIDFSLPLAGPVTRGLASTLDLFLVSTLVKVGSVIFLPLFVINMDFAIALLIVAIFVVQIGYGIFFEWIWRGQTVGKRLLKLRVVDEQGLRLEFTQIVVRNLMRFVDMLPYLYAVGGVTCLFTKRCQRLGDLAANTVVVRQLPLKEPDLDQLALAKFNSLREHGHLAARLRQQVSPREAGIALEALLRREAFDPEARVALFSEIAARFKSLVAFPPEAVETMTDEQYLRNVVDILFRTRK
ncbi:MAG TPA: RDD family protein [Chthoniobacteraceae bacterium]|nr:RDD family protein [Chthoniobacteraceae bacterium]